MILNKSLIYLYFFISKEFLDEGIDYLKVNLNFKTKYLTAHLILISKSTGHDENSRTKWKSTGQTDRRGRKSPRVFIIRFIKIIHSIIALFFILVSWKNSRPSCTVKTLAVWKAFILFFSHYCSKEITVCFSYTGKVVYFHSTFGHYRLEYMFCRFLTLRGFNVEDARKGMTINLRAQVLVNNVQAWQKPLGCNRESFKRRQVDFFPPLSVLRLAGNVSLNMPEIKII